MRSALACTLLCLVSAPAAAQHAGHHAPPAASSYAGLHEQEIKALGPEQIADLRAGRGMGLALAAELNGYPGPLHAVELAAPLELTEEQRRRLERLVAEMRAETIALGEQVIAEERRLDALFASRRATRDSLTEASLAVGRAQGTLRAAHLRHHLATLEALTQEQAGRYAALRGYAPR